MKRTRNSRALGIMACMTRQYPPFPERLYFEQLTKVGKQLGVPVIVFNPKQVIWPLRQVHGYVYDVTLKRWCKRQTALPTVIYDRCFYFNPSHYRSYQPFVQKLRLDSQVELLGVPLKGKWQLTTMINHSPLAHYLPHTERYLRPQDALTFLKKYDALVAKPTGGSHGRGIVAILRKKNNGPYYVTGRTKENTALSHQFTELKQLLSWLHRFIGSGSYLLQPYLHLRTRQGLPFDIRVLMQKNEQQKWQLTGMAVRTGHPESLTSNLHGGGRAEKAKPFLEKLWGDKQKAHRLGKEIQDLCHYVPLLIERKHGRLCELGIDIGIDSRGRVWLLEVNSKPGRQVFRQAGEKEMYLTAIKRPLLYARSLLQKN